MNSYFGERLKGIKKIEKCWVSCTKDLNFILDWADPGEDQIFVSSCCSGHGFKFSPVIGKIVRDMIVEGKTLEVVEKQGHIFKIPYHEGINLK